MLEENIEYSIGLNLLYVEDSQEAREMTLLLMEEFFDNITVAVDGQDGLDKFRENDIDIIITDINMPKMNGLAMAEQIRDIDKNIPILIISAHNESDILLKSIKIGIDGYLLKPINFEQFTDTLNRSTERLYLRKENLEYKNSLEQKVQEQVRELRGRDHLLEKQSRMASMGEMIDVIAHQWMQPLSVITTHSSMLTLFAKDGTIEQERVERCIHQVKEQVAHLVDTLSEFRKFYRPNQNIVSLNLKSLFDSIVTLVKDDLHKQSVKLTVDCDSDLFVKANENDIKHLFINLINNAKDEMVRSDIAHDNRDIFIRCISSKDLMTIEVEDSGKGIPDALIEKIFKVDFTTKEDSGGTGIGLYMCRQIVDKHHGDINVSNSKDGGAIFSIKLKK